MPEKIFASVVAMDDLIKQERTLFECLWWFLINLCSFLETLPGVTKNMER